MFLIEERIAPNGEARVLIYMRPDGLFEGRLYQRETRHNGQERVPSRWSEKFNLCALTETLPRAQTIVYEELGLLEKTFALPEDAQSSRDSI